MGSKTQLKWEARVHDVISEWFLPDPVDGMVLGDNWFDICGKDGLILEECLKDRDLRSFLLICYRLVIKVLTEDHDEYDLLDDFFTVCHRRLHLPRLELKHIYSFGEWHDFSVERVKAWIRQDLSRAELCIRELEAGEYWLMPHSLAWPWEIQSLKKP